MSGSRIAILAAAMDAGGAERVALFLAEAFADRGHQVDLVLVRRRGELLTDVPPNVRIVDLAAKRAITAVPAFRRYLREAKPDAALAINYEVNLTAAAAAIGLSKRPKLLLSIHSAPSRYVGGAPFARRMIMSVSSRLLYKAADWLVAVSEGIAGDLRAYGWAPPERVATIYNPVLRHDFNELVAEPVDHPWFADRSLPVILAVGRLTAAKDYPLLLDTFARVTATQPARLMIVGEGEERPALEAQIARLGLQTRVDLLGYRRNPYPYMRAADLFVLSSAWEGFGNVLVEAMAAGTDVVSTDCSHGPAEILEGGRWGELVPPGNSEKLAAAILRALDRPREGIEERARTFTVDAAAEHYLGLILS